MQPSPAINVRGCRWVATERGAAGRISGPFGVVFFGTFQQLGEKYIEDGHIYFTSDFESTAETTVVRCFLEL